MQNKSVTPKRRNNLAISNRQNQQRQRNDHDAATPGGSDSELFRIPLPAGTKLTGFRIAY